MNGRWANTDCPTSVKDDNLDDLPPPKVLQQEIIDHLEAALAAFRDVATGLPRS